MTISHKLYLIQYNLIQLKNAQSPNCQKLPIFTNLPYFTILPYITKIYQFLPYSEKQIRQQIAAPLRLHILEKSEECTAIFLFSFRSWYKKRIFLYHDGGGRFTFRARSEARKPPTVIHSHS